MHHLVEDSTFRSHTLEQTRTFECVLVCFLLLDFRMHMMFLEKHNIYKNHFIT